MSDLRAVAIVIIIAVAAGCSSPSATTNPTTTATSSANSSPTPAQLAPSPTPSDYAPTGPTPSPIQTLAASPTPTFSLTPSPTAVATPTPTPIETVVPSPTAPTSGVVEVVAGGGAVDPGDGGNATDAHLTRLTGLAVGSDGTLWIVDSNAGTLRTVTPDGLIHTAANGMYGPQGMCLTADGVPYIAERGSYRVVTTNGHGGVRPVAGNALHPGFRGDGGPAKKAYLSQPYDVASDAAGNLYIADTSNSRVRSIDAQSGTISTIAGNGTYGFAGDGGQATDAELASPQALAVDPGGTVLYIADYGNSHLRRVDLVTGIITTVAGNESGSVAYDPNLTGLQVGPTRLIAIALDAQGYAYLPVFFTDKGQMVMRLSPSGILTVVAGGGTTYEPGVPATDWALPPVEVLEIEPRTGALLLGSNDGRVYRIPGVATPRP